MRSTIICHLWWRLLPALFREGTRMYYSILSLIKRSFILRFNFSMIKNKTICKAFSDINRFESQREVFLSVYLSVMIFKIKIIDKINI